MQAFAYASPASTSQAISLLDTKWGSSEILAGGTDLLALMKEYVSMPQRVINIKGIAELRGIRMTAQGLRLGALATFDELASDKLVMRWYPAIAEAAAEIGGPQIRSMGTVGGNLCQRPRCWYYRAGYGLLARDTQGRPLVPGGDNRYHAILGNSGPAYFVSPSTLAPVLIAFGARLKLMGPSGLREMLLENFFVIPQAEGQREHALAPNELVTEVLIPSTSEGWQGAAYEVRERATLDWPLATAAVALNLHGGTISGARVVLGHVAPKPWTAGEAEKMLTGIPVASLDERTAAAAGEAAVRGASPLSRNAYKVQLARVAVKRALLASLRRSAHGQGAA